MVNVKGNVGWLNTSLTSMETSYEVSSMCQCLSVPDATSLAQEQAAKTDMLSVVRIQFSILYS